MQMHRGYWAFGALSTNRCQVATCQCPSPVRLRGTNAGIETVRESLLGIWVESGAAQRSIQQVSGSQHLLGAEAPEEQRGNR